MLVALFWACKYIYFRRINRLFFTHLQNIKVSKLQRNDFLYSLYLLNVPAKVI